MQTLKQRMQKSTDFLLAVELVTSRGTMSQKKAIKTLEMSKDLARWGKLDWMSITDNPGGNPMIAPLGLGEPLRKEGAEIVIHLACKDLSRTALESQTWQFANQGFYNILALTGDYPLSAYNGCSKSVADIDSVGLLTLLSDMRRGLIVVPPTNEQLVAQRLKKVPLFLGAAVTNYKMHEGEVLPQFFKLQKKLEAGADFIISQIGYDARKAGELIAYFKSLPKSRGVPLVGNVYLLKKSVAKVFHAGKIPGVVVSDGLLADCEKYAGGGDKGHAWFLELAAKQVAIFRGLGYRGAYLGGIEKSDDPAKIMEIEASFAADDWKGFAKEVAYSRPQEFFYFAQDPQTGLADPGRLNPEYERSLKNRPKLKEQAFKYRLSRSMHHWYFSRDQRLWGFAKGFYARAKDKEQGPPLFRRQEHMRKAVMFNCKDCGDCSLAEIAYLCPESQCQKNQRNGPCGGTRDGLCEVRDIDCIWKCAYERLKHYGEEQTLLDHAPVIQDNSLRCTSAWANLYLNRDHAAAKFQKAKASVTELEGLTIIGESINDSVPSTKELFDANNIEGLKDLARSQDDDGAAYIDVNVGQRDPAFMAQLVRQIQSVTIKPLSIDTPDKALAAAGLGAYDTDRAQGQKPILNSISMMRLEMLDLYEICPFKPILLLSEGLKDNGESILCKTVDETCKTAKDLLQIARTKCGIKNEDCIFDAGIAPIAGDMEGFTKRVLGTIERLKADPDFAGAHFSVGLSNFTVMLPTKRANGKLVKVPLQNAFLTLAVPLGLDIIIGAAGRKYKMLSPDDDALVCLKEFLALDSFEAIMRIQQFYS